MSVRGTKVTQNREDAPVRQPSLPLRFAEFTTHVQNVTKVPQALVDVRNRQGGDHAIVASRDDLMTLDGIGEVRADAIIRARPFKAKTELVERRLIPESLYEKIADKVTARPPPAAPPPRPAPQKRT